MREDISHITIFADNSDMTVYEFFNEIEMSVMGWGMNSQGVYLLLKLLSKELKTKTEDVSES